MKFMCSIKGRSNVANNTKYYTILYERQIDATNAYEAMKVLEKDEEFNAFSDKGNIYQISVNKIGG